MNVLLLGLCATVLALSASPLLAADPAPATTTLAPVSVQASDTMVMQTPSVQVRVTRQKLQQQNVTESADAVKYAPNMLVIRADGSRLGISGALTPEQLRKLP